MPNIKSTGKINVNILAEAPSVLLYGSTDGGSTWKALTVDANGFLDLQITQLEDVAHQSGDAGVMALGVRKNADGPLSGTDGDYEPLQTDANGFLKVNIKAGAGSGGTASTDDAAFTAGAGAGTPMMGFVTADTVDAGDVGVLGMDAARNLKVSIEVDNAGIGGGTQYAEDAAHASGNIGTLALIVRKDAAAQVAGTDGDYSALINDASGRLHVLDANSAAIKTAVEKIDDAIAGSEMQVDVVSQPVRDRTTDNVGAGLQTDVLMNDVTALTPKFVAIAASLTPNNTLITAVGGKKLRVLGYCLVAASAVTVRFESGVGGSALTGQMQFAANSGVGIAFNPLGWFETAAGALLNLELSAAVSVAGHLIYVEV